MTPEALLCLHCGYYMLEYVPGREGFDVSYDITGWGERWTPMHHIEPFGEREYIPNSDARKLWNEVWRDAWCEYETQDEEETYIWFDYLYFGM